MTKRETLCETMLRLAWGYILLHVFFNQGGRIDILPDWGAYALFLTALPVLGQEDPSADLLRPLGLLLFFWELLEWIMLGTGQVIGGGVMNAMVTAISLYFHFQLLTNVANLAAQYAFEYWEYILKVRNVRTIAATMFVFVELFRWNEFVLLVLIFFYLGMTFWLCVTLFRLKKHLAGIDEAIFDNVQKVQ